jgi:hypothetical protein
LQLDEVGRSVREALDELCNSLAPRAGKQRDRVDDLKRSLESIGLSFKDTTVDGDLPIGGYLILKKPDWLLYEHPALAVLHPVAWHWLRIA